MFKKLFITTIVGTIAYFLFGWVIFDFLLGSYTNLHTTQLVGFKKTDAYAALLSFILVYLLNSTSLLKAFLISTTIGVLVAIMTDSYWYATSHFYSNTIVILLDILAAGVTVGFMGCTITLTNKQLK